MLQHLAVETEAQAAVIGAMIFFLLVFAGAVVSALRRTAEEDRAAARLPLEDAAPRSGAEQHTTAPSSER